MQRRCRAIQPGAKCKLEREALPPPHDDQTLRTWAKQLGLKPGSDDLLKFFDYAAVATGRIPDHILEHKELTAHLPAFFRVLALQEPSRENTEKLLAVIKGTRRP